jgi:serine/threonine-protein kinase
MPLGADQKFADYIVVRPLGAGGMGEVYLAQHPRLPRRDALKLLVSDVSVDPTFRQRFLREADLASTLWHPHIVGVHDRGEYDGRLWISMDYVDGEDAASLLSQRYPAGMPQELVTTIVTAVASALDYAHKKGLLHRDVKPANILLTHLDDGEQRILLTDFGIARTVDDVSGLTATNTTLGTVWYTAPEQLMGEQIDGRADQYSLAATTYQLLTGTRLFDDSNAAVVIGRHLNTEPPSLAVTRPELAALDPVLAAGLAKDPDDRFRSCSDFARALAAQASGTAASTPAAPTTPAPVKRPTTKSPSGAGRAKAAPTSPLSPGWYPDPSGTPGTLYWDGNGWRTAPLPTAGAEQKPGVGGRSPLLWLLGLAAAVLLIGVVAVFALGRDDGQPPTPSTSVAQPAPTVSAGPPQTVTVSASPPQTVTVSAPPPAPVPVPQQAPYWNALIVGTCDEGGSCGVQQRTGPYNAAPRKYSNDLKDGMTVSAVCKIIGDGRSSEGRGVSYVWYQLLNGAYINSVYTNLNTPLGMPTC